MKKEFNKNKKVAIVKNGKVNEYIGTEFDSDSNYITFTLWEKFGKRRVYMNDYKNRGVGYIDLDNNNNDIVDPKGYCNAEETAKWFLENYAI